MPENKKTPIRLSDKKIRLIVITALFAVLTLGATLVVVISLPGGGYFNLGDAVILLGAFMLGPIPGAAAAGIGAAMADLTAGYTLYAPASLIIKAAMAFSAGCLFDLLTKKPRMKAAALLLSSLLGEVIMIAGYFLYEWLLTKSAAVAALGIPGNSLQAAAGIAASTVLYFLLWRIKYVKRYMKKLR